MPEMKRISIRLDERKHNILKFIGLEDGLTMQDMFLNAVEEKYSTRIIEKEMKGIE